MTPRSRDLRGRMAGLGPTAALGTFVATGAGRLHVLDESPVGADPDAAPLVLLHGASGNLRDWWLSPTFRRLAAGRRTIALDRPGFGHSDPASGRGWRLAEQGETIRSGLRALGVRRWVAVGHSWSGALALDLALQHPEEIVGLGILAGATMPWGGALSAQYRVVASPVIGPAVAALAGRLVGRGTVRASLEEIFAPQPVPPRYLEEGGIDLALVPRTFRTNARALAALHEQVAANRPRYDRITCPAEVIHGEADRIVPARIHARPLAGLLPAARLTVLPGVGHMPHHARPEEVADRLLALPE